MDLNMIGKLYAVDGPFVSLYLDATSQTADAVQQYATRWHNVERELKEEGVDAATVDAVSAARGEHGEGNTRVVIAAGDTVQLALSLPERPVREVVRVAPLPHVAPLVDAVARSRPHVVALIDRSGADIYAYTTGARPSEFAVVDGDAPDIRKLRGAGGWSHRRIQARADEGWKHNAKEIASTLDAVCSDVDPALIVVAGDVREVQLVREQLPAERQPLVEQVEGGRAADGSAESLFAHVADKVEERRDKDAIDVLAQYAENRGRGTLAAEGLEATVAALRSSQVDTLLLAEDYTGEDEVWFGPDPVHVGTRPDELTAMGVEHPQQAPAVDAVLRAALATHSAVVRVPGGVDEAPRDGIGALLRFDLES